MSIIAYSFVFVLGASSMFLLMVLFDPMKSYLETRKLHNKLKTIKQRREMIDEFNKPTKKGISHTIVSL